MANITIDQGKCTGCGACVEICSVTHVYSFQGIKPKAISPSRCWNCGQCVAVCPVDAIEHSSFPLDLCPLIKHDENDLEKLTGMLRERRSTRVYQEKPIQREKVEELVNIARWAPSGRNLQAISWLAVDDQIIISAISVEIVERLQGHAVELRDSVTSTSSAHEKKLALMQAKTFEHLGRRLEKGEKPIFFGAPVVLFAVTPNSHFGRDDAVISGYTMQLAAVQMGLATCQIGYFIAALEYDANLGRDILNIPEDHTIQMVIALGFPKFIMRRSVNRKPLEFNWVEPGL